MTTREDIRSLTGRLRAAAVKFEKNAHLGQPIRSAHVYARAIDVLQSAAGLTGEYQPSRYGLADACTATLFRSKNGLLDREQTAQAFVELIAQIDELTATAKASRP